MPGIVISEPSTELVDLVREIDPAVATVDVTGAASLRAALVRRRFGLALPPPFSTPLEPGVPPPPVRPAVPTDGAAIAAVKWRTFGVSYRGVLPDPFLDTRDVVPPASFWVGRAMVPPSRRHVLLVWGRPGEVRGYVDAGPCRDADVDPERTGEVFELYVDPSVQGNGGGSALLAAAVDGLVAADLVDHRLWTIATNDAAHAFYRSQGWSPDGGRRHENLGAVALDEVRFRRS